MILRILLSPFFWVSGALGAEISDGLWNGKPLATSRVISGVEAGDAQTMAEYAYCSRHGWGGVSYDEDQIFFEAAKSAVLGNPLGQAILSRCYLIGQGVEKNQAHGFRLAEKSAAQGHPLGVKNLANCYLEGLGVEKDVNKGIALQKEAAAAGSVIARENLMRWTERESNGFSGGKAAANQLAVDILNDSHGIYAAIKILKVMSYDEDDEILTEELKAATLARAEMAAEAGVPYVMARVGYYYAFNNRRDEGIPLLIQGAKSGGGEESYLAYYASYGGTDSRKLGTVGDYATRYRFSRAAYVGGWKSKNLVWDVAKSYLYNWGPEAWQPAMAAEALQVLSDSYDFIPFETTGLLYVSQENNPHYNPKLGEAFLILAAGKEPSRLHQIGYYYGRASAEDIGPARLWAYLKAAEQKAIDRKNQSYVGWVREQLKFVEPYLDDDTLQEADELIGAGFPEAEIYQEEAKKIVNDSGYAIE